MLRSRVASCKRETQRCGCTGSARTAAVTGCALVPSMVKARGGGVAAAARTVKQYRDAFHFGQRISTRRWRGAVAPKQSWPTTARSAQDDPFAAPRRRRRGRGAGRGRGRRAAARADGRGRDAQGRPPLLGRFVGHGEPADLAANGGKFKYGRAPRASRDPTQIRRGRRRTAYFFNPGDEGGAAVARRRASRLNLMEIMRNGSGTGSANFL